MYVPITTYRLQLYKDFDFSAVAAIAEYLKKLGVSDVYSSPILKARPGSKHCYDVVNPLEINPDLNKQLGFNDLIKLIKNFGLGWLLDIVPNHMAYDTNNSLLMDVFEYGKYSEFSEFFDIDWDHVYEDFKEKVVAPFLGRPYGECLESGEITLIYCEGGFRVKYYDFVFPLRVESYETVLSLKHTSDAQDSHHLTSALDGERELLQAVIATDNPKQRKILMDSFKKNLWVLYNSREDIKYFIDTVVSIFNGSLGNSESFDLMDSLLNKQIFHFSFWKVGTEEINYRRFFTVNDLICLNICDEKVFLKTHELICSLVSEGLITGLRVDHIDGLADPLVYLRRLRNQVGDLYVVVEKILLDSEELPESWPVHGTTGYDFLNKVNNIFVERSSHRKMLRIYSDFSGLNGSYLEYSCAKKRLFMGKNMVSDIENLAMLIKKILAEYRYGRDITIFSLRRALVEIMAQFSVYRTYADESGIRPIDVDHIKRATAAARNNNYEIVYAINIIERVLLRDFDSSASDSLRQLWKEFGKRFQQFTGPLMAKAIEDTLFYVYNPLISLNEVGGEPNTFGMRLSDFHLYMRARSMAYSHSMNTLSTHDTKRGEDVRARINVLSEIPEEWHKTLSLFHRLNRSKCGRVNGEIVPDKNDEYFLYQTLIGAFPFNSSDYDSFVVRIKEYIIKAVREAKVHTAWLKPDSAYEEAFLQFVDQIFNKDGENSFLDFFLPFVNKISFYGMLNSLSQTLIKLTAPGVADIYQGTELWDLSLVDPDNRRPVDFALRKQILDELILSKEENLIEELLKNYSDGRVKMYLIYKTLMVRNKYNYVFLKGEYIPLNVAGKYKENIIAYLLRYEDVSLLVVVPRFLTGLIDDYTLPLKSIWKDTAILVPFVGYEFVDVFTDTKIVVKDELRVDKILCRFPVALCVSKKKL